MMRIKRALISVCYRAGTIDFARELNKLGIEIIATSNTLEFLKKGEIKFVKHVTDVTNFPEILNGRVKTMHPKLIGGILARRDKKEHMKELKKLEIMPIDMVVCNLTTFEKVTSQEEDLNLALERIDIGGPCLIRAAAKNFENVIVVISPHGYDQVLEELKKKGDLNFETRFALAVEAFRETARYDSMIYRFLERRV